MASPSLLAEQATFQFFQHWSMGLQPSLSLTTNSDGSLCATLEVSSSLPYTSPQPKRRHRSGRASRLRRQDRRNSTDSKSSCTVQNALTLPRPENTQEVLDEGMTNDLPTALLINCDTMYNYEDVSKIV